MAGGKLNVNASFPTGEGRAEQGILTFVDNAVDRTTGTIKLKAEFTQQERRFWPGQFINVTLTLATQGDAVVIPSEAIQVGPDGQQVFVVKEDKRVEVRPVSVGRPTKARRSSPKGSPSVSKSCAKASFSCPQVPRGHQGAAKVADDQGRGATARRPGKAKADGEGKATPARSNQRRAKGVPSARSRWRNWRSRKAADKLPARDGVDAAAKARDSRWRSPWQR